MNKYTDGNNTVHAENYREAAEKLYGQQYYINPMSPSNSNNTIPTTYVYKHRGYAEVLVFAVGDKQGTYWGIQQGKPAKHIIKRI